MSKAKAVEWVPWDGGKAVMRRGTHAFTKRLLNWWYCAHCGLVLLKNDVTRVAAKKQCEWEDDQ